MKRKQQQKKVARRGDAWRLLNIMVWCGVEPAVLCDCSRTYHDQM